jgi:protease I
LVDAPIFGELRWNEKTFGPKEEVLAPKVLLLTGDAAESLEVMYPYQRLVEEGYEVDIAASSAKRLQFVIHDFVDEFDTYTEKLGYPWPADVAFADVDPSRMSLW